MFSVVFCKPGTVPAPTVPKPVIPRYVLPGNRTFNHSNFSDHLTTTGKAIKDIYTALKTTQDQCIDLIEHVDSLKALNTITSPYRAANIRDHLINSIEPLIAVAVAIVGDHLEDFSSHTDWVAAAWNPVSANYRHPWNNLTKYVENKNEPGVKRVKAGWALSFELMFEAINRAGELGQIEQVERGMDEIRVDLNKYARIIKFARSALELEEARADVLGLMGEWDGVIAFGVEGDGDGFSDGNGGWSKGASDTATPDAAPTDAAPTDAAPTDAATTDAATCDAATTVGEQGKGRDEKWLVVEGETEVSVEAEAEAEGDEWEKVSRASECGDLLK